MEEWKKQLNRITKAINEIPFEKVYIEIETSKDKIILERNKRSIPIGFKVGDSL